MVMEEIAVIASLKDINVKSGLEAIRKKFGELKGTLNTAISRVKAVGLSHDLLTRRLFDTQDALSEGIGITKEQMEAWDEARKSQAAFSEELTRFSSEYLSTMFFFMGVGRIMRGLIGPSMDLIGVNKMLSTTLGMLFLPAVAQLLPVMMFFMNLIMAIPAPLTYLLAIIVGAIWIYSKYRMVHDMVILGLQGMAKQMKITVREGEGVRVIFKKILRQTLKNIRENKVMKFALGLVSLGFSLLITGGKRLINTLRKVKDRMEKIKMGSKGMAGGMSMLTGVLPLLGMILKPLLGLLTATAFTIAGISVPVWVVIGVILLLIVIFVLFRKKIANFVDTVKNKLKGVGEKISGFFGGVKRGWEDLKKKFGEKLKAIVEWAREKWDLITSSFSNAKKWAGERLKAVVEWAREKWEDVSQAFSDLEAWVGRAWETTVSWAREKWEDISDAFGDLTGWVDKAWEATVEFFRAPSWSDITSAFDSLTDWTSKGWEATVKFYKRVSRGLTDFLSDIGDWVDKGFEIAVDFVKGAWHGVQDFKDKISDWVSKGFKITVDFIVGAGKAIWNFLKRVWEGFKVTVGLSKAEKGGIFTRPTVTMIGEKGPEAVIPLGKGFGIPTPTKVVNVYASPTFNITATVSSDIDIEELASELNARFEETVRTLIR